MKPKALVLSLALAMSIANVTASAAPSSSEASRHGRPASSAAPELVSVAMDRTAGGGALEEPGISANGRLVAFASTASNLLLGDTNSASDVFVRDRVRKTMTRVSVARDGAQTQPAYEGYEDSSATPRISADGREVAFESWAHNLYRWETNVGPGCQPWCPGELAQHFYVHYLASGETRMIDTSPSGAAANDGGVPQAARLVLSGNGRYAAFGSDATNLVPFPGETHAPQVYVKDLKTGAIERVSVTSRGQTFNEPAGIGAPLAISNNGKEVVFQSSFPLDPNRPSAPVFVRNRSTHTTTGFATYSAISTNPGQLSGDGGVYGAWEFQLGGVLNWELKHTPPLEATKLPSVLGRPFANSNGSVFYFVTNTEATADGLGPGIFAYNRLTGATTRSTVVSGFDLQAAAQNGKTFVGLGCEGLTETCGEARKNVYVQSARRPGA